MVNGIHQHIHCVDCACVSLLSTTCACMQVKYRYKFGLFDCMFAGEVVLDQQSSVRTVVNKTDSIDNTFRFFKMELLAGEDNMNATVRENGCTFTFDFSKVYWNSRLHTEHERVIGLIKPGDVVVDVFAGVGPFAVPAAKKDCTVYANDLNPHSYASLVENAKINRVSSQLHAFNMDGRDFLRKVIPKLVDDIVLKPITQLPSESVVICNHIVMNLPATAVLFLNVLKGLFLSVPHNIRDRVSLPTVHCYCFAKSEQPDKESREMVEKNLGACLSPEDVCSVFNVRHVAPNKVMMRVTFRLPKEVAFNDIGNSAQGVLHLPTHTHIKHHCIKTRASKEYTMQKHQLSVCNLQDFCMSL